MVVPGDVAPPSPAEDAPFAPRAASDSPMAHCHCARDTRSSAPSGGTIAASRANAAKSVGTATSGTAAGWPGAPASPTPGPSAGAL